MRTYEGFFVFPPEATPETRKSQEKNLEDAIRKFDGTVILKTEVGRKPLGYAIRKFKEAHIFLFDFQLLPAKVGALKKTLRLYEELLYFMITVKREKAVKKPEANPAPGAEKGSPVQPSQIS